MRMPNPWIAVPVLIATIAGGVIGFQVMRVSCAPESCLGAATGVGVVSALAALAGVGTVVILAVRSIAEWRRQQEGAARPPQPEDPEPPTR